MHSQIHEIAKDCNFDGDMHKEKSKHEGTRCDIS